MVNRKGVFNLPPLNQGCVVPWLWRLNKGLIDESIERT
jgi:hypothetical protein